MGVFSGAALYGGLLRLRWEDDRVLALAIQDWAMLGILVAVVAAGYVILGRWTIGGYRGPAAGRPDL